MYYAIGDIHGQFDLLNALYKLILKDIEERGDDENVIVFLGDYIDRGPQNRNVLDFLMNLKDSDNITHVMILGNHEEIFMNAMKHPNNPWHVEMWVDNGGAAFMSEVYCRSFDYFHNTFYWPAYVRWMEAKLEPYYETEHYVFVHGGLDIRKPDMKDQATDYLMWARHTQKDWYRDFHKIVIHGHTPNSQPVVDMNRINVDTSWWITGKVDPHLTAVALPNVPQADIEPRFLIAKLE